MTTFNMILFLYICGVLISSGLIYTLNSYGLLRGEENTEFNNDLLAKVFTALLSWITIIVFICGIIKGIILALKGKK